MRILRLYSLMAAAVVLAVGPAQATTYSSLSSWQAAVNSGSVQTVDFSSFLAFTAVNPSITGGTSPNTATFSGTGAASGAEFPYVYNLGCCGPAGMGNYILTQQSGPTHGFNVALGQNTNTAFGVNLWTTAAIPQTITVTITFSDSTTTSFSASTETNLTGPAAFTGYAGTKTIASVDFAITASGINLGLDNFTWGQALAQDPPPPVDTVEATTIAYVGMGMLAIYAGRRRKLQLA